MTREQIKSKNRMSVTVDRNHIDSLKNADEIIDKIFDDHEAIIKAKDEEIERLKAELVKATKRFDAKNKESKALKKTQAKAWIKYLKDTE